MNYEGKSGIEMQGDAGQAPSLPPRRYRVASGAKEAKEVVVLVESFNSSDEALRTILQVRYLNEPCLTLEQEKNLRVVSVTLHDGATFHAFSCKVPTTCVIGKTTKLCFVYKKYHVVFMLDCTASMYNVTLVESMQAREPVYALPASQVMPVLRVLLESLLQPLSIRSSSLKTHPSIRVSVILKARMIDRSQKLLIGAALLNKETFDEVYEEIASGMRAAEASRRLSTSSKDTTSMSDADDVGDCDLIDFVAEPLASVQLMDPNACPSVVTITDGAIPAPKVGDGSEEMLSLPLLRRLDIPLNFVIISGEEMISGAFGNLPDLSSLLYASAFTKGVCMDVNFIRSVQMELNKEEIPTSPVEESPTTPKVLPKRSSRRQKRRAKFRTQQIPVGFAEAIQVSEFDWETLTDQNTSKLLVALLCRFSQLETPKGSRNGLAEKTAASASSSRSSSPLKYGRRRLSHSNSDLKSAIAASESLEIRGELEYSKIRNSMVPFFSSRFFQPALEPRILREETIHSFRAIDHPFPWQGRAPAVPVLVKEVTEYRMRGPRLAELLGARIKQGFISKELIYDKRVVCMRLGVDFAPHISVNYVVKVLRSELQSNSSHAQTIVSIRLIASAVFHKSFCEVSDKLKGVRGSAEQELAEDSREAKVHRFINSTIETDQVLIHLRILSLETNDDAMRRSTAKSLLAALANEDLARWYRWFRVQAYDLLFPPSEEKIDLRTTVTREWATFTDKRRKEFDVINGVRLVEINSPIIRSSFSSGVSFRNPGFAEGSDVGFIFFRLAVLSDFVASVYLAFPASSSVAAREVQLYEFMKMMETNLSANIKVFKQSRVRFAELCRHTMFPLPPSRYSRGLILPKTRKLVPCFLRSYSWNWTVPDFAAAHYVSRSLIRARLREDYMLTSTTFPVTHKDGSVEIEGEDLARLDSHASASFCRTIPAFDKREMRQSKDVCLVQYRVSITGYNTVRSELVVQAKDAHFKLTNGQLISINDLRKRIHKYLAQVDSFFVSNAIAFLDVQSCAPNASLIPFLNREKLAKEGDSDDGKKSVVVQEGVETLLRVNVPYDVTFAGFRQRGTRSKANQVFCTFFRNSLAAITDAELRSEKIPPGLRTIFFAKVLDANRVLIIAGPRNLARDGNEQEVSDEEDAGWVDVFFPMKFFEFDNRKHYYPAFMIDDEMKALFGLPLETGVIGEEDNNEGENEGPVLNSASTVIVKQIEESRIYDLILSVHEIFESPEVDANSLLNMSDLDQLLRACPTSSARVEATLLRKILSSTTGSESSEATAKLHEIDERFEKILEELFVPIESTVFYKLDHESAAALLQEKSEADTPEDDEDDDDDESVEFSSNGSQAEFLSEITGQDSPLGDTIEGVPDMIPVKTSPRAPPVFFRAMCTTHMSSSSKQPSAGNSSSIEVRNGRICSAILDSSGTAVSEDVSVSVEINLIFCALPKHPVTKSSEAGIDSTYRRREKFLSMWTSLVRQKMRSKVKAMVSSSVLASLQHVYPVTEEVIGLVRERLDEGSLPSSSITRTTIALRFVDQDLGEELFLKVIGDSPFLSLRSAGSDVYFMVEQSPQLEDSSKREYVVPYWAIITVAGSSVRLEFYHPSLNDPNRARYLVDFLRNGVLKTGERVNQLILLQQLHDTRMASRLLIKPDNANFDEESISRKRIDVGTESSVWSPKTLVDERFACPCYHRERFEIPERLSVELAIQELRVNALHSFIVGNRENTFVYRERQGKIYYLKLREDYAARLGAFNGKSNSASSSAQGLQLQVPNQNAVVLEVYGVDPPPLETKDMLSDLLSQKIANETLTSLARLLHRNPQFKIQPYDLRFVQKNKGDVPQAQHVMQIPDSVKDVSLLLVIFRANLVRFMHKLHFASNSAPVTSGTLGRGEHGRSGSVSSGTSTPEASEFQRQRGARSTRLIHPAFFSSYGRPVRMMLSSKEASVLDVRVMNPVFFGYRASRNAEERLVSLREDEFAFVFNSLSDKIEGMGATSAARPVPTLPLPITVSEIGTGLAISFLNVQQNGEVLSYMATLNDRSSTVTLHNLEGVDSAIGAASTGDGSDTEDLSTRSERGLSDGSMRVEELENIQNLEHFTDKGSSGFSIFIKSWERGGIDLVQLFNCQRRAFQDALQEYDFELNTIERPLQLFTDFSGTCCWLKGADSSFAVEEKDWLRRMPPTFATSEAMLQKSLTYQGRSAFLREVSKILEALQPGLCHLCCTGAPEEDTLQVYELFDKSHQKPEYQSAADRFVYAASSHFNLAVATDEVDVASAILSKATFNVEARTTLSQEKYPNHSFWQILGRRESSAFKSGIDAGHVLLPCVDGAKVSKGTDGQRAKRSGPTCLKRRGCFALLILSEIKLQVLLYNWAPTRRVQFSRALDTVISWFELRSVLYRSLCFQRLGLFRIASLPPRTLQFLLVALETIKSAEKALSGGRSGSLVSLTDLSATTPETTRDALSVEELRFVFENPLPPEALMKPFLQTEEARPKVDTQRAAMSRQTRTMESQTMARQATLAARRRGVAGKSAFLARSLALKQRSSAGTLSTPPRSGATCPTGEIATRSTGGDSIELRSDSPASSASPAIQRRNSEMHQRRGSAKLAAIPLQGGSTGSRSGYQEQQPGLFTERNFAFQMRGRVPTSGLPKEGGDALERLGSHFLREAEAWSGAEKRAALIKSVLSRWRQEWTGHPVTSARFPWMALDEPLQDDDEAMEFCVSSPSEIRALLCASRIIYTASTPLFLSDHSNVLHNRSSKASFSKTAIEDLIHLFVHSLVHQLGMRHIVFAAETSDEGEFEVGGGMVESRKLHGHSEDSLSTEAFAQQFVGTVLVLVQVKVDQNVFKCALRLIEPELRDLGDYLIGEAHANAHFLMHSKDSHLTPSHAFPMDLGRVRDHINLMGHAYDFHLFLFKRALKNFTKNPVEIACQVFHFAERYTEAPPGSKFRLVHQSFQFHVGAVSLNTKIRSIFTYVVESAERYGMVGLKPHKPGGRQFLFISCNDGSFTNPFQTQRDGYTYAVVVGSSDNNFTEEASNSSSHRTISLDVCLIAGDETPMQRILALDNKDEGLKEEVLEGENETLPTFVKKPPFKMSDRENENYVHDDEEDSEEAFMAGESSFEGINLELPMKVTNIEKAVDHVETFLTKVFSHAALRLQRKVFWDRLKDATSSILPSSVLFPLGEDRAISIQELNQLSFRCSLESIEPSVSEILKALFQDRRSARQLIEYLSTSYGPVALRGRQDERANNVVILPPPELSFLFVIHVQRSDNESLSIELCFQKPYVRSQVALQDGRLFISAFVQSLLASAWDDLSTF